MNALIKTLLVLAVIGAVNWGLVGLFEWNLVQAIFAGQGAEDANTGERIVYALVGIGGLLAAFALPRLHMPEHRARRPVTA